MWFGCPVGTRILSSILCAFPAVFSVFYFRINNMRIVFRECPRMPPITKHLGLVDNQSTFDLTPKAEFKPSKCPLCYQNDKGHLLFLFYSSSMVRGWSFWPNPTIFMIFTTVLYNIKTTTINDALRMLDKPRDI